MSMMMRLDVANAASKSPVSKSSPYFTSVMIGYVLGLAATLGCMYWFEHAQVRRLVLALLVGPAFWFMTAGVVPCLSLVTTAGMDNLSLALLELVSQAYH